MTLGDPTHWPPSVVTLVTTFSTWPWGMHRDHPIHWESWALCKRRTTEYETAVKCWMDAPMGTFRLRMRMRVEFAPLPGKLWRLCKPRSSCCMNQSVNQPDWLIQNSGGVSVSKFVWKTVFFCYGGMASSSSTGNANCIFPVLNVLSTMILSPLPCG